jgi:flagellar biosynthesis/type III secretory pathway M-ring protein FliF/YscJ
MKPPRPVPALPPVPEPAMLSAAEPQEQMIVVAAPETEPVVLQEIANPVRDQVIATVEQRPEASARVIRSWLKED